MPRGDSLKRMREGAIVQTGALPFASPKSIPSIATSGDQIVALICNRIKQGMPYELAADAEMLDDGWKSLIGRKGWQMIRREEALFVQEKINVLLSSDPRPGVPPSVRKVEMEGAKHYIETYGKFFNQRNKKIEYVIDELLEVGIDFVPKERWPEYLQALSEHDNRDQVMIIDERLHGDR